MHNPRRFTIGIGLALAIVLTLVWEQVQATRLGYRVEQARAAIQAQDDADAYLRVQLQKCQSPAWLADQAKRRLGMVPETPASVVQLPQTPAARPLGLLARLFGPELPLRAGSAASR